MSGLFHGPLRAHPDNGRYFTDESGAAIYLTGSHTWDNLQDIGRPGDPPFPYAEYLEFMQSLRGMAGVGAAFAYALSAPSGHDSLLWRKEGDESSEILEIVSRGLR